MCSWITKFGGITNVSKDIIGIKVITIIGTFGWGVLVV
jgi:hypothetical protein